MQLFSLSSLFINQPVSWFLSEDPRCPTELHMSSGCVKRGERRKREGASHSSSQSDEGNWHRDRETRESSSVLTSTCLTHRRLRHCSCSVHCVCACVCVRVCVRVCACSLPMMWKQKTEGRGGVTHYTQGGIRLEVRGHRESPASVQT